MILLVVIRQKRDIKPDAPNGGSATHPNRNGGAEIWYEP